MTKIPIVDKQPATDSELLKRYSGLYDHLDSCDGITLDVDDMLDSGEFTIEEAERIIILRS